MTKILFPDFSQKKVKAPEDLNRGPFVKKEVSSINDATGTTIGKVNYLLKIKANKSQFYDFANPNEMNKKLWFIFFDEFVESLREEFISDYIENEKLEELEKDFTMIVRYFRGFFHSLYDYDQKADKISLHLHRSDKDKKRHKDSPAEITESFRDEERIANILVYEYLLDEAINEGFDDIENSSSLENSNFRVEKICDGFRSIHGKKGHKVFRLIGDYGDFFMENFRELDQINSLVQAVSFYAQNRINMLSCVIPEDSEYEEYWV